MKIQEREIGSYYQETWKKENEKKNKTEKELIWAKCPEHSMMR